QNRITGAIELGAGFVPLGSVAFSLPDMASLAALVLVEAQGSARGTARFDSDGGKPSVTLDALIDHVTTAGLQAGEVRISATAVDYMVAPVVSGAASAGRIIAGTTEVLNARIALSQAEGWTGFDGGVSVNG